MHRRPVAVPATNLKKDRVKPRPVAVLANKKKAGTCVPASGSQEEPR